MSMNNMATRTLEQTIKELELDIKYSPYEDLACDALDYLKEYSSSPERKKGKLKTVGFLTCQCSECGAQFHELEYTNFCPNCGADMRGE